MNTTHFELKIQAVDQISLFELSWGQGQRLHTQIPIAPGLLQRYQDWQRLYLTFYQTTQIPLLHLVPTANAGASELRLTHRSDLPGVEPDDELRGKKVKGGRVVSTPKDWRMKLVESELRLLHDFHQWLRSPDLYDIRARLATASRESHSNSPVEVFLSCSNPQIARLPWEAWEIGTEFAAVGNIRIARAPANIRNPVNDHPTTDRLRSIRKRPRILAILGDDTGLSLAEDKAVIQTFLASKADIEYVGWTPGTAIDQLKSDIVQAIAHPLGWDLLFFAGHSNEMKIGGGELAIAPNTSIALREIQMPLMQAQQNGLQFALFNSCNGMDLADTLIDLGFSQVAVMREPIHNRVAQSFLMRFLQSFAAHKDVQDSLLAATQFLKSSANLTHPSAHLVPTLFRHPQSALFRIEATSWAERLRKWAPTRYEAIALALLTVISWPLPIQNYLIEQRGLLQAQYRQLTQRVNSTQPPPVALVRIDNPSLAKRGIINPKPISQAYLADIIEQLTTYGPEVIGIDYLLDRPDEEEATQLATAVEEAIAQDTTFVFASIRQDGAWVTVTPIIAPEILETSLAGDISGSPLRISLPRWFDDGPRPLTYEVAHLKDPTPLNHPRAQRWILTMLSYNFGQRWLDPIIDYSLPPDRVYENVPAWTLFDDQARPKLNHLDQQAVLLVPGGYAEAGIQDGEDNKRPR